MVPPCCQQSVVVRGCFSPSIRHDETLTLGERSIAEPIESGTQSARSGESTSHGLASKDTRAMNKLTGAILMLSAAISGHGVFVFLADHPSIRKYDVPPSVANLVLVAIAASTLLGLWGMLLLLRHDPH